MGNGKLLRVPPTTRWRLLSDLTPTAASASRWNLEFSPPSKGYPQLP